MSCIPYPLWPGCIWAAITKALSSGPLGPFTQWCNVCALMPSQQPSTAFIGGPAKLEGGCTAVRLPLRWSGKRRGWEGKSWKIRQGFQAWGLGDFPCRALIPALLQCKERDEAGWGLKCIPLSSCPGGVSALAAKRWPRADLRPCRHACLRLAKSPLV